VPERVALSLPILQDMIECVLFQQHANPDVLLVGAMALKEPGIDLLTHRLARRRDLGSRGSGMISQIGYEP
jgi:hypothetical protein